MNSTFQSIADTISAADLEKFAYCPLNWKLSLDHKKHEDEQLIKGQKKHVEHEMKLKELKALQSKIITQERFILAFSSVATILALMSIVFLNVYTHRLFLLELLTVAGLIWMLTAAYFLYRSAIYTYNGFLSVKYRNYFLQFSLVGSLILFFAGTFLLGPDIILSQIIIIFALFWLIGATYFLYRVLITVQISEELKKEESLEQGAIEYVADDVDSTVLKSEKYMLTGKPDYIEIIDNNYIPVEIKSGRVPRGPLFSHKVQLYTYCLLVEEVYKKAPPFGILQYQTTKFRVDYTPNEKELVLNFSSEMRDILAGKKEAHRNHERSGKCRACSRRKFCLEKL